MTASTINVYACSAKLPLASVALIVKLEVPITVGVPVKLPLVANDIPVGNEPEVLVQV